MATQLSQFYTPYLNCCINWEEKINWRLILSLPFRISVKYELHTKYCFNLSSWTHDSKKKLECWKQYLRRMACVSSNLICWKSCALLKCNYSKTGAAYIIWGDEWRVVTLEGYLLYIILQSIYMLISMGKHKGNLNSWGVRDKCQHLWAAQQILVPSPLLVPFALAEPLMEFILSMGWVEQGCVQGGTAAKAPSTQIWAEKQHMEGKNPTWGMRQKCVLGFSEQHH